MKELTCIICPKGCSLKIDDKLNVTGAGCPRGVRYAKKELTHPERTVTSTVEIKDAFITRLPVKTDKPVLKEKMMDVMAEIKKTCVTAPVKKGDVIIKDVCSLGVDVVAARTLENNLHKK